MYEKLNKIRGDLSRAKKRREEAEAKVKALEEKLREAENNQVIADVTALKLTPEQVAQFLQLAASGKLPVNGNTDLDLGLNQQGKQSGQSDTDWAQITENQENMED